MKKYLMTGAAALAIFAAFTSCSKGEELYDQGAIDKQKEMTVNEQYIAAFEKAFGKVGANVDWGFSSKSKTRANTGANYPQTSDGINANANEWANNINNDNTGFGGWVVPPALTPEQKAVVTAYFQSHPKLEYNDPQYRHFFVQQVYKGGTSQAGPSSESITAADGKTTSNSGCMNLLTVGANHQHINNFNGGSYNGASSVGANPDGTVNVLDNGSDILAGKTSYHPDQIMLMVNIDDTSCFGYHETASSTHHDNKAGLVGWETIHNWAKDNYPGYNNWLDDTWERSFLGFDLALREGAQAYDVNDDGTVNYATYDEASIGLPDYAWDGENLIPTHEYEVIEHEYYTEYKKGAVLPEFVNILNGTSPIGWLSTNENFYVAGEKLTKTKEVDLGQQLGTEVLNTADYKDAIVFKQVKVEKNSGPETSNGWVHALNLKLIKDLAKDGYLPVNNKSLTEWVKVGTSDGYFTDWIVTLIEAKRQDTPTTHLYRVIAEDLTANDESDFDFNDVVFDVVGYNAATGKTTLKLIACGGTLHLTVGDVEVHSVYGQNAPNADGKYTMFNTGGATHAVEEFEVNGEYTTPEQILTLPIVVTKDGVPMTLEAKKGVAACKILVDDRFPVVPERHSIANAQGNFTTYVQGHWKENDDFWWVQTGN